MNNILNEISRQDPQAALEAPSQLLRFQRKQTLYHNGDPAQSVFRVHDGLIRITRMTPEGRILTVRHVMPGDFFGEEAFMDGRREEIAEALTNAQVEAIDPKLIKPSRPDDDHAVALEADAAPDGLRISPADRRFASARRPLPYQLVGNARWPLKTATAIWSFQRRTS